MLRHQGGSSCLDTLTRSETIVWRRLACAEASYLKLPCALNTGEIVIEYVHEWSSDRGVSCTELLANTGGNPRSNSALHDAERVLAAPQLAKWVLDSTARRT